MPNKFPLILNKLLYRYSDSSADTTTYVAIKILTLYATARIVNGVSPEYKVFRKIKDANPNSPGFNHCLSLRDVIVVDNDAGAAGHICFVTDPLSSTLSGLRPRGKNRFPIPIAKRIIKQVLLALDYLHRECGYIHTGRYNSCSHSYTCR